MNTERNRLTGLLFASNAILESITFSKTYSVREKRYLNEVHKIIRKVFEEFGGDQSSNLYLGTFVDECILPSISKTRHIQRELAFAS